MRNAQEEKVATEHEIAQARADCLALENEILSLETALAKSKVLAAALAEEKLGAQKGREALEEEAEGVRRERDELRVKVERGAEELAELRRGKIGRETSFVQDGV